MDSNYQSDIDAVNRIPAVATILEVVCRTTGMGFAAVARVTEDRWIACKVLDEINFGLQAGGELKVETTICDEIRGSLTPVVIDDVPEDELFRNHHTPAMYGFRSYISVPIVLSTGKFFGTLCSIDPRPARLKTPAIIGMFKLFAELIAFHLEASERLATSEASLRAEREVSDLREQFIAVIGHDLRNPLGAVVAGADSLLRIELDDRSRRIAAMMKRSAARMGGLIDDVLDFARGRLGGGLSLSRNADQPLEPVLHQVVNELRAGWPDREIDAQIGLFEPIHCDRGRIAQLFSNLLGNALTHGATGQPVRVRATSDGQVFELWVANAGLAIPPLMMERLFQPFCRGTVKLNQEGLGLGLYIANEIARAHGGTIEVSSTDEETRFTFRMRVAGG